MTSQSGGVPRADDTLHREFFRPMQEQIHLATTAISEARKLAYAVMREDVNPETLRTMADLWLDRFGRDPLTEVLRDV